MAKRARRLPGGAGGHHVEAFLEMMSAERGAALNTLESPIAATSPTTAPSWRRAARTSSGAGPRDIRAYLADLDDRGFAARLGGAAAVGDPPVPPFLFTEGMRERRSDRDDRRAAAAGAAAEGAVARPRSSG